MNTIDQGLVNDKVKLDKGFILLDGLKYKTHWKIEKYDENGKQIGVSEIDGNLLLNEGINLALTLVAGGAGTPFNNANAHIGVGDSNTAESAAQTGLQAATNKLYKAMDATYPTYGTSQQVVYRSTFGPSEANWAWNEFTVANGDDNADVNLNRKVSAQGTKVNGQTWVVTMTLTLS